MANELVFTNAYLWVNGIDLSAYVTDITMNVASESLDATTMGRYYRKHKGGVLDYSFDISFMYDRSTGGPTTRLYPVIGTTSCVEFRAANACTSVNNPSFFAVTTLETLPIGGSYGTLLKTTAKFNGFSCLQMASSS
jgi:hypothetical protein